MLKRARGYATAVSSSLLRTGSLRAAVVADDISHWRPGTLPVRKSEDDTAVA